MQCTCTCTVYVMYMHCTCPVNRDSATARLAGNSAVAVDKDSHPVVADVHRHRRVLRDRQHVRQLRTVSFDGGHRRVAVLAHQL